MVNNIRQCIDFFFPPRPTQRILRNQTQLPLEATHADTIWHLSPYTHPTVRAAILENKFHSNQAAAQALGQLLTKFISQHNLADALFIPVPLGKKRLRTRGYNQVTHILEQLPEHIQTRTNILLKIKDTPPQTQLNKAEREQNVHNVFSIHQSQIEFLSQFTTVVIVDDVLTTGATLRAAHAALVPHLPAHTRCLCVALAH